MKYLAAIYIFNIKNHDTNMLGVVNYPLQDGTSKENIRDL